MPNRKIKAAFIEPMLLVRTEHLPEGEKWLYELKLDGYRALAIKTGEGVQLRSRNDNDFTLRYAQVAAALRALPDETVIDGEVVALDEAGRPSFNILQNYGSSRAPVVYYVFDLLILSGQSVMDEPLHHRRELLEQNVLPRLAEPARYSPVLSASLYDLVRSVKAQGLEGLVAKRRDSRYEPGQRSGAWQKMRIDQGQEFVIGGYTVGGTTFDALVFGYYEGDRLLYSARTRNGFTPKLRDELLKRVRALETPVCPFANLPEAKSGRWGQGLTAANSQMRGARFQICWAALQSRQQTPWIDKRIQTIETFLRDRDQSISRAQATWGAQASNLREYWAPARGLVASFAFEKDDEGKPEGTMAFAPGHVGRAAAFDGKTYLTGSPNSLDINDPFTITTWFLADSTPDGSLVSEMQDNPKGKGFGVHLDHGKLSVNLTSNWIDDAIRLESENALDAGRWHHVAVTYSGSKLAEDVHVYVDGQPAKMKALLDTLYRPYRNSIPTSSSAFGSSPMRAEFVEMLMVSTQMRAKLSPHIKTAAGQHGISGKDLKSVSIPLPLLPVQERILGRVTSQMAQISATELDATRATQLLDRLDRLDHATLAKAFRGELVSQQGAEKEHREEVAAE